MSRIVLVSGWSAPGGSTEHHIALTNLLNANGLDCTFYGPQEYHLNRCKAGMIYTLQSDARALTEDDFLVSHFINPDYFLQFPKKKHILSCHETEIYPLKDLNLEGFDVIQFVSNWQKGWHKVNHPSVIIPPIVEKVAWTKPEDKFAGVIGSIDRNKQTHLAIKKALADGYEKVLLFGDVTDHQYFNQEVAPYLNKGVFPLGVVDKSQMYNRVQAVYHASKLETFGLVRAECEVAGIPFIHVNPESLHNIEVLDQEEILNRWKKILN